MESRKKIYHIIHCDKLASVIRDGGLFCDVKMTTSHSVSGTIIGNQEIKGNRLRRPVDCHPGLCVGDCVPFYFCPRSVMLYVIHRANHPNLAYKGGQGPIIHLELDLEAAINRAQQEEKKWAFTDGNAASGYAQFYNNLDQLSQVDWEAVHTTNWSGPNIKEKKQAEFLVEEFCPWDLVERIGVQNKAAYQSVISLLPSGPDSPRVEIRTDWYYY